MNAMAPVTKVDLVQAGAGSDVRERIRWAWRVIWLGKGMILACLALALVPAVMYVQQLTPRYTAEATILIEAPDTGDTLLERSAMRARVNDAMVQTEAEVLESSPLAQRVIAKLGLDRDPEFNVALRKPKPLDQFLSMLNPVSWLPDSWRSGQLVEGSLTPAARAEMERARITRTFLSRLNVKAQRRAFIITVQFTSESREQAARIANTLADLYVLDRLEAGFEETRRVSTWLGERLDSLRRDVVAAETAAEEFRSANGLRRKTERQGTITDQQLSDLSSRLVMARTDLAQKQARLDQVRALARGRGSVETAIDVLQSPLIQRLREQEVTLQREISEASKTYAERHPRLVGIRADLAELRGKISNEIEKIAASVVNEVEVASTGVRTLEREMETLRRRTDVAGEAEVKLRELERQADAGRAIYEAFLSRFKREAEQERIQRANARVLSPADIPVRPSYPNKQSMLLVVTLFALAAGVGLVFLLERMESVLRSADESEILTGLPTLAMIPMLSRAARRAAHPEEEVIGRPRSPVADAVRSLRTTLIVGEHGDQGKVIAITSSVPKEGKSFVAISLARLFARAEQRVLLIDADVYRPRVHSAIGFDGERGLVHILQGEGGFDELVVRDTVAGMDVLPAGHSSVRPEEALTGPAMARLLEELSERYDRIVIDTPPVLAVADTRVIAPLVNRVVYLVKWNSTPREAVRNGVKLLREARAPLAGVVLSQVDQQKHARYGYGDYGQYYGRYREYYGS